MAEKEILLSVQHLEKYFKKGFKHFKAVDDVSFDVYKGEAIAIVGESSCGKTVLGKSIVHYYDITGGSVYFRGQRICAGKRRYEEAIKNANDKLQSDLAELKKDREEELRSVATRASIADVNSKYKAVVARRKDAHKSEIKRLNAEIALAKYDNDHYDEQFIKSQQCAVDAKYASCVPFAARKQMSIQLAEINAAAAVAKRNAATEEEREVLDVKYSVMLSTKKAELKAVAEGHLPGTVEEQRAIFKDYKKERQIAGKDRVANKIRLVTIDALASLNASSTEKKINKVVGARTELLIVDSRAKSDASLEQRAIEALKGIAQSRGLTVIFTSRELSAARQLCNRIAIMRGGVIVELAPVDELISKPLHPYTKSLLTATPYNGTNGYTTDVPILREVADGHFVRCNQAEFEQYQLALKPQEPAPAVKKKPVKDFSKIGGRGVKPPKKSSSATKKTSTSTASTAKKTSATGKSTSSKSKTTTATAKSAATKSSPLK